MTASLADTRPGDIMFSKRLKPRAVEGLVWAGQLALGQTGYPQHVGVVVDGGRLVQAMPRGAEVIPLDTRRHWTGDIVFIRPNYRSEYTAPAVARAALRYVGTPYSFLDYVSIAAHRLDPVWKVAPGACGSQRLAQYVRDSGHMICSQLADQALADAGWHVFDDGRLPQDVTPADLYRKMRADVPALVLGVAPWA
jgi:hypothetical protein